jgi:hypothetical protein
MVFLTLIGASTLLMTALVVVAVGSAEWRWDGMPERARIRSPRVSRPQVELTGRVRRHGPELRAPLTGNRCVHYWVLVEDRSHRTVAHEEQSSEFSLVSEGCRATVLARRIQARGVHETHFSSLASTPRSGVLRAFLASHGIHGEEELRLVERRIEEGDRLTIVGEVLAEAVEAAEADVAEQVTLAVDRAVGYRESAALPAPSRAPAPDRRGLTIGPLPDGSLVVKRRAA